MFIVTFCYSYFCAGNTESERERDAQQVSTQIADQLERIYNTMERPTRHICRHGKNGTTLVTFEGVIYLTSPAKAIQFKNEVLPTILRETILGDLQTAGMTFNDLSCAVETIYTAGKGQPLFAHKTIYQNYLSTQGRTAKTIRTVEPNIESYIGRKVPTLQMLVKVA